MLNVRTFDLNIAKYFKNNNLAIYAECLSKAKKIANSESGWFYVNRNDIRDEYLFTFDEQFKLDRYFESVGLMSIDENNNNHINFYDDTLYNLVYHGSTNDRKKVLRVMTSHDKVKNALAKSESSKLTKENINNSITNYVYKTLQKDYLNTIDWSDNELNDKFKTAVYNWVEAVNNGDRCVLTNLQAENFLNNIIFSCRKKDSDSGYLYDLNLIIEIMKYCGAYAVVDSYNAARNYAKHLKKLNYNIYDDLYNTSSVSEWDIERPDVKDTKGVTITDLSYGGDM